MYALRIQSDGKILIGGNFTEVDGDSRENISRLNTNGSVDSSFDTSNGANNPVRTVGVQSDGKVVIGGEFTLIDSTPITGTARLNTNGSIDSAFAPTIVGGTLIVYSLAVQPDNMVIMGGNFISVNGQVRNNIARLDADGSVDSSFGTPTSGTNDTVWSVALQSDGKALIGGDFTEVGNQDGINRIARVELNGDLDTTIDPGNGVSGGTVQSILVQPDAKTLIGGDFTTVDGKILNRIARFNVDGSLDTGFDELIGTMNGLVNAIQLRENGKIFIGGDFTQVDSQPHNYIAQLNANGTIDSNFDNQAEPNDEVWAVALQDDGKVLLGGDFIQMNGTESDHIARLDPGGALDATFDTSTGPNNSVRTIAVQDDGKVIIAGGFTLEKPSIARKYVARLMSDGSLDTTFDTSNGPDNWVYAVAGQDEKVIIGGNFTHIGSIKQNHIARLTSEGFLDATFNIGTVADKKVLAITQQVDGKILIGGSFNKFNDTARNSIARLNADGSLDTTFDPKPTPSADLQAIAVQSDGKILIAGNFDRLGSSDCYYIARLNANGSLDSSFDWSVGVNNNIYALGIQPDGKVVIGGSFTLYDGEEREYIARLNGATAPVFTSRSPAVATYNASYSHTFTASGYPFTTTLRLSSGDLPPGLSFDAASGELSGIPAAIGVYDFSISASNWVAPNAIQEVDLAVKAITAISITNYTPSPSTVGEAATVAYTVTAETGTATGNVTVSDGTDSCIGTVASGSCSLTKTTAGEKTLTAAYPGAETLHSSTSTSDPHTVNKADTITKITGNSPNPSDLGETIVISYTVTSAGGIPTGLVTITDGSISCTGTSGEGICKLTLSTAGNKNLIATYSGYANFNPSTSASVAHTVDKADPTTSITSHIPDPSKVNTKFTVTFTVDTAIGTPTGYVNVRDGTDSCTGTLAAGFCELKPTKIGHKTLTATYAGDSNFNTSTFPGVLHIVNLTGLRELHMPLMRR